MLKIKDFEDYLIDKNGKIYSMGIIILHDADGIYWESEWWVMERLTYNEVLANQYYPNENIDNEDCFNKLGKLEDLEDELGIPLEVLFKSLKDGVYIKERYIKPNDFGLIYNNEYGWLFSIKTYMYDSLYIIIKDYGKTWWLEKPKEEKDD